MGSNWHTFRLGDVCTKIGSGATPRGGRDVYLESGPFALIRSQNVHNTGFHLDGLAYISREQAADLDNVEVLPEDVLLNITGDSVARACQVDVHVFPARVNQHVAIIRPDPERLDPTFLRYFFVAPSIQSQLLSWASAGATRNALTKAMIESFEVFAPQDISEQQTVARILRALDDKIELNRGVNETLEAIARATFKSWFVDFEPVRAKVDGRQPSGTSAEIATMFPEFLEESEAGLLPAGWRTSSIGEEFDVLMGQSPPGNTYNEHGDGVPFYQGKAEFGARFPTRRLYCTAPKRMAKAGDTLVSVRAPVGAMNMAAENCCVGRGLSAVRHKSGSRSYTYYVMHALADQFESFEAEGTVFGSINKEAFASLGCIAPPPEVITAFERFVGPIDSKIELLESESRVVGELRDTLLPKLISGEIRIGNSQAPVGAGA